MVVLDFFDFLCTLCSWSVFGSVSHLRSGRKVSVRMALHHVAWPFTDQSWDLSGGDLLRSDLKWSTWGEPVSNPMGFSCRFKMFFPMKLTLFWVKGHEDAM